MAQGDTIHYMGKSGLEGMQGSFKYMAPSGLLP